MILHPSPWQHLDDVQEFLALLAARRENAAPEVRELFSPGDEVVVTRAPGRLDVMGGIADYSGSLVLQLPLREATLVALGPRPDRVVRIVSLDYGPGPRPARVDVALAELERDGMPLDYDSARAFFRRDPDGHWAAYVAGAFVTLMRERGVRFRQGANLLVSSRVPAGKGVSSSAALEVASLQALASAVGLGLEPREVALLCQKVENLVVGAPCGVMDQMTAVFGEPGKLMALLCQPAELQEMVSLPDGIAVWGLDSGVRHSVSGADYGSVRVGAFMGYRVLADLAGLEVEVGERGAPIRLDDPRWGGYLANVAPSEWEAYAARVPEQIDGRTFLERYSGTTDPVTRVDPGRAYAVRVPTAHPIHEHFRVRAFAELLRSTRPRGALSLLGELMDQSHASYGACGLGEPATDRLVALVRAAGPARGLHGAKITGGGSGGTVAVIGEPGGQAAVEEIAAAYVRERGEGGLVFSGSSPGAAAFGHLRFRCP